MPNYDVFCELCSIEFEEFAKVGDKDEITCYMCNAPTKTLITQRGFQFIDGYDEHLNEYITGPAHREKIMRNKGMEEVHKVEITRLNNDVLKVKNDKGIEKAVDSLYSKGQFNPKWSKYV